MAVGYYSRVLVVHSNGDGSVFGFAVNEIAQTITQMIARILPET